MLTKEISGLKPGTLYYFKMQARTKKGWGPLSNKEGAATLSSKWSCFFLDSFWRVTQFIFINLEVQLNFFQADTPAAFTVLEYLLQNVVLLVGGSGWWGMSVSERCLFIDIPILD